MMTSVRVCGSSVVSVLRLDQDVVGVEPRAARVAARCRGSRCSRTPIASRPTAPAGPRARRSPGCAARRPTWSTLTSCVEAVVGLIASAASVATRMSASPAREASASARFSASPRSPVAGETAMPSIAARTRPRSVVPLTTTRAVRPAAMTLTVPFAGSSLQRLEDLLLRLRRGGRRDVRRGHARGRVDDDDDVAGEARRALEERPRREDREQQRRAGAGAAAGGCAAAAATGRSPRRRSGASATAGWTARRARRAGA